MVHGASRGISVTTRRRVAGGRRSVSVTEAASDDSQPISSSLAVVTSQSDTACSTAPFDAAPVTQPRPRPDLHVLGVPRQHGHRQTDPGTDSLSDRTKTPAEPVRDVATRRYLPTTHRHVVCTSTTHLLSRLRRSTPRL